MECIGRPSRPLSALRASLPGRPSGAARMRAARGERICREPSGDPVRKRVTKPATVRPACGEDSAGGAGGVGSDGHPTLPGRGAAFPWAPGTTCLKVGLETMGRLCGCPAHAMRAHAASRPRISWSGWLRGRKIVTVVPWPSLESRVTCPRDWRTNPKTVLKPSADPPPRDFAL